MQVALMVTCLTESFQPRAAVAVVRLLRHLGCTVEFPPAQTCCGQPMFNNGQRAAARDLALRMIQVFQDYPYVVTPSGSCAAMIKEHYPELLADNPELAARGRDLAQRTHEFVRFLTEVLRFDPASTPARWEGRVTYHYSCHLRPLGVEAPMPGAVALTVAGRTPRAEAERMDAPGLLQRVAGLEYVPLDRPEQCCGFGGTFATKYPRISGALVAEKVAALRVAKVDTVVSNEAGCTMNMAGRCRREGLDLEFKTLAEILAESLGLLPRGGGM